MVKRPRHTADHKQPHPIKTQVNNSSKSPHNLSGCCLMK